ncbi:hypothetical protein Tco_1529943, partial [Tanacetum coccineum]
LPSARTIIEGPYEDIRQAYLVGTDTESEPFEDLETELPESPYTIASPISFPDSTPPTCHVNESKDSNTFGVRSTSSDSTAPLALDHSLIHDTLREDANKDGGDERLDEGHKLDDKSRLLEDESHGLDDEGHGVESDRLGLEEETGPKGQQRAALVVETAASEPLELRYGALRRRELAAKEDQIHNKFEVGQGYGSLPEPKRPERVLARRYPTLTARKDLKDGRIYIDIPIYPPPVPPVQKPPSPEWS